MKRTTERVLTWIGIALQLIAVIILAVLIPMFGNSELKDTFINQMMQEEASVTYEEANAFFSTLSGLVTTGLVIGIVILIIALIAAFLIGKKAKVAGILLIIAGVISLLGNWINAVLWIIAGIMLLVRKPKAPVYSKDNDEDVNPYIKDGSQVNEHNNSFVLSEEQKENEKEAIKDEYTKSDEENKYKY
ncbi:DUF4064 domain-containing protein [Staphylococcus pseudoxylosus]|uniref:DUF4064 domain-containing protein n=1 Tax=Staphylococcus pseudoxylosus TaxID=2282419 RepID=UPI002DB7A57B|nr:DUF4064 domain-containing protein [Staphylococcus pseudoxylosus]MEB6044285.1 DUF4064 domain-containing protein [Staphylococcus pseudoxylosus]MEB8009313.1 DUF4064 domain-containing protein [Staphylococcus pseudoxylosus]